MVAGRGRASRARGEEIGLPARIARVASVERLAAIGAENGIEFPRAPWDAAMTERQGHLPVRENASVNSLKLSVEVRHEIDGILA